MVNYMNSNDNELKEAIISLERRINEVSSNDGIVSIKFTGMGDFLSVNINLPLEELDKETLEKSIVECLELTKKKTGDDLFKMFKESIERTIRKEEEKENEEYGVTIDNVS